MLRSLLRAARPSSALRAARPASRSPRAAAAAAALAVALGTGAGATVLTATGCETSQCNVSVEANPAADFRGGLVLYRPGDEDKQDPIYVSSSPGGDHLNFNAGAQYRIFHGLGACPMHIEGWVSFSRTGVDGGNEARPAGNMFEVVDVNDESFTVRNDTCGDYWLRVVASDPVKGCGQIEEAAAGP
ncbi:MAG: hypothetical protein EOO75_03670 [Myxococcales bacterium]|nr:MAG: hypothetical protein EOO75_03670 [Myxococcales bacterium]